MLGILTFINILIVITIAVYIPIDNPCLEELFESTMECPLPASTYNRSATLAFHVCSLKAIGVLDDNNSYMIPQTRNEVALVAYGEGIDDCAGLDDPDTPVEDVESSLNECLMTRMNLLKINYECPQE